MKHLFVEIELRSRKKAVHLHDFFVFIKNMFDNEVSYSNSYKGFSFKESYTNSGSQNIHADASNSPFTVLTSDKEVHSFSTANYEYDDWNAYSITGTSSFVDIHQQVSQSVASTFLPQMRSGIQFPDSTQGGYVPPTGQTDPEFASPIGEPLFPILLLACLYTIGRCLAAYIRKLKSANPLKP